MGAGRLPWSSCAKCGRFPRGEGLDALMFVVCEVREGPGLGRLGYPRVSPRRKTEESGSAHLRTSKFDTNDFEISKL